MPDLFRNNKKYTDPELFRALQEDGIAATEQEIQKARVADTETLYKIGDIYYKKRKYEKAFAWFYKAALQDHEEAQARVGRMYLWGEGVSQDSKQAMDWSMKAVSAGNATGQYNISELYYYGRGVSQDYKQAMDWYLKAANNGSVDAMYQIGYLYENGDVVTKSIPTAIEWYTKAANQGNTYAQYGLGDIYETEDGFIDLQKAVNWYQKAVDNGLVDEKYNVFRLNEQGYYAKEEEQEANTQSENETIQSNDIISDINNSQTQPSTTTSTNDNSIESRMENLEKIFQSKSNIIEGNNDALQKELATLKQEKLQQHEENKQLRDELAELKEVAEDNNNNDFNYDSSDSENDINYDSECSNSEDDDNATATITATEENNDALKKELAASKPKKLEQHEENKRLKERMGEAGIQNAANNDLNCNTSVDEDNKNNNINYHTESSNGVVDNNATANSQQNRNHRQLRETSADPNYNSFDNEDPKNDIYLN